MFPKKYVLRTNIRGWRKTAIGPRAPATHPGTFLRGQKSAEVMLRGHYAQIIKLHSPLLSESATIFIAVRFDNPVRRRRLNWNAPARGSHKRFGTLCVQFKVYICFRGHFVFIEGCQAGELSRGKLYCHYFMTSSSEHWTRRARQRPGNAQFIVD